MSLLFIGPSMDECANYSSICTIISQFINTAISDDVMVVNHTLATCADDVESFRCTSPWNPFGRTIIFVEIPAFNHSDPTMQKKIPELITKWLTSIWYALLPPLDMEI